ncbi:hypothetical protein OG21DRAFT_814585 [Imleria badia]|nr:hypothetical protein OG21DRAFT_814585 [Imleria badia]
MNRHCRLTTDNGVPAFLHCKIAARQRYGGGCGLGSSASTSGRRQECPEGRRPEPKPIFGSSTSGNVVGGLECSQSKRPRVTFAFIKTHNDRHFKNSCHSTRTEVTSLEESHYSRKGTLGEICTLNARDYEAESKGDIHTGTWQFNINNLHTKSCRLLF